MPGMPAEMALEVGTFWSTLIQAGLSKEQATQLAQTYVGARMVQQTILSVTAKLVATDGDDEPWKPRD